MNKSVDLKYWNIAAVVVFVLSFGLCAVFGWLDVVNYLFSSSGDNIGEVLKMPPAYTIVCFVFLAVLCTLVILGTVKRSKVMLWMAGVYEVLFVLGFVSLAVMVSGNITSKVLFDIITYFLTAVLIPVYGVIWQINLWFFIIFIALIVVNVIGLVKAYKNK